MHIHASQQRRQQQRCQRPTSLSFSTAQKLKSWARFIFINPRQERRRGKERLVTAVETWVDCWLPRVQTEPSENLIRCLLEAEKWREKNM